MTFSHSLKRISLLASLLAALIPALPCLATIDEQDGKARKFIQVAAEGDQAGALKALQIASDDADSVSVVHGIVQTLKGKPIDDVTRTSFDEKWTNGLGSFNATYHIRTGKQGYYFFYSYSETEKGPPSIEFSLEEAEADPWEVKTINFTQRHWRALVLASLLAFGLFVVLVVWMIKYLQGRGAKPPKLPVG